MELQHHGILGQKWGKRNGPPYPLSRTGDWSAAERRQQKKNYKEIKKTYKKYKWNKSPEKFLSEARDKYDPKYRAAYNDAYKKEMDAFYAQKDGSYKLSKKQRDKLDTLTKKALSDYKEHELQIAEEYLGKYKDKIIDEQWGWSAQEVASKYLRYDTNERETSKVIDYAKNSGFTNKKGYYVKDTKVNGNNFRIIVDPTFQINNGDKAISFLNNINNFKDLDNKAKQLIKKDEVISDGLSGWLGAVKNEPTSISIWGDTAEISYPTKSGHSINVEYDFLLDRFKDPYVFG